MKPDALNKAEACSGPCEKCINFITVFGPQGKQCRFGSIGPLTDKFRGGVIKDSVTYEAKAGLADT